MRASVVERLLETLFRRWWLYALPLLGCIALGGAWVMTQPDEYLSAGVLRAEPETLLTDLADRTDGGFGFETPATVTSRRINEAMLSDEFVLDIVERGGLTTSFEQGLIDLDFVRQRVSASAEGDNLLAVGSVTEAPELSHRIATATIDSYIASVIEDELAQSIRAQEFFEGKASEFRQDLDEVQDSLDQYLEEHPAPSFGERPASEQSAIARLNNEFERLEGQYVDALGKFEESRLASQLAEVSARDRLKIVDAPGRPVAPLSGLRAAAMSVAVFVVLGLMLAAALVVVAAFLDRTVRTVDEVKPRLGMEAVASVPHVDLRRALRGYGG